MQAMASNHRPSGKSVGFGFLDWGKELSYASIIIKARKLHLVIVRDRS